MAQITRPPFLDETAQALVEAIGDLKDAVQPENTHIDFSVSIAVSDWSNTAPYEYTWLNRHVTPESAVEADFGDGTNAGSVDYVSYEKVSGGVKFTVPSIPSGPVPVAIRIFNAEVNVGSDLDATMISTEAVAGAGNVEQGLAAHSQAIGNLSNLTTTEKGSLVGAANELNSNITKFGKVIATGLHFNSGSQQIAGIGNYNLLIFIYNTSLVLLMTRDYLTNNYLWGGCVMGQYQNDGIVNVGARYGLSGETLTINSDNRGYTTGSESNYSGNTAELTTIIGLV